MRHVVARLAGVLVAASSLIGNAVAAPAAASLRADVFHSWTSGSEAAAIGVVARAYEARGGSWHNDAIAGFENASSVALNRILGGDPPTAMAYVPGPALVDLAREGVLAPVDDDPALRSAVDGLPAVVREGMMAGGHIYGVPLSVSTESWIFYSRPVFVKVGLAGPPGTVAALFADLDRLKQAGFIALAWGGQPWQELEVFDTLLLSQLGLDGYRRLYARDETMIHSEAMLRAVTLFGRLRAYVDPGEPNRNWNDAANMVIGGRAGMQIMGDWVKGEFRQAGQRLDRDYGCVLFPADDAVVAIADAFVFPKGRNQEGIAARRLLARTVLDPATQLAYSVVKGSVPARADLDTSSLDACSRQTYDKVRRNRIAPDASMLLDPDTEGALADLVGQYWSDPSITPKAMVGRIDAVLHQDNDQ